MVNKQCWSLLFIGFLSVSCSEVKNSRYKDLDHLEVPPRMEIVEIPKAVKENRDEAIKAGLGGVVSLAGTDKEPIIKIKKLFDRSWVIVEQALKLKAIKITDKNRDQGVFYVLFDADKQQQEEQGFMDSMSFFIFDDQFEEATYKLTVAWHESDTEVRAELVDQANLALLDDDEDREDFAGSVDQGAKLIVDLFTTIRDDLPLD